MAFIKPPISVSFNFIETEASGFLAFLAKDPVLFDWSQEYCLTALTYRKGARGFMLGGVVILSVALFLLSKVNALWQWILLNGVVLTIGASLIGNLVVNVTLAKWFVDFRGRAIAFAAMGVSFAGVLLTPLATWAIDLYGWRTGWQLLSIGAFIFVVPAALAMRRSPEDYNLKRIITKNKIFSVILE